MKKIIFCFLVIAASLPAVAQLSEKDVRARLDLIHSGRAEGVRNELPLLQSQYPGDVGVKYLDAYLTENGDQALKKYQMIVDQFPKNEWADDALYKVYQYYYAVGLYKTAEVKMNQLNEQYPTSIYAKRETNPGERIPVPVSTGTESPVRQPVTEESTTPAAAVTTPASGGPYAVQVGVYSKESAAQEQARQMTATVGRPAVVFPKQSGGKTVYAVAFDGFSSDQTARSFGAELKSKHNLEWFIVQR
ncbi:MAG: SPOR domain-containing protein [Bacteroidota bacterium]